MLSYTARKYPKEIKFEDGETIAVFHNRFNRKVRGTLGIQKHDRHISAGGMNHVPVRNNQSLDTPTEVPEECRYLTSYS